MASKKKKLRIAFIGGGGIAGHHATYLAKYDDVEIIGVSDVSKKTLATWKKEHDVPGFTDYRKMLRELKPDAVDICTPNSLHYKPALDAMNAGCHVFVEKPMAMNARECQTMINAAKKKRRKLVVAFQHRFEAKAQFIKGAIDEGQFGKILYTRVQYIRRRGIPNWGVFGRKELQGGGCMIDVGVHALEMVWNTIGAPKPVAASGNAWTFIGNDPKVAKGTACPWPKWDTKTYDVEDLAAGQIRFADGSLLSLEISFATHSEHEGMNFWIHGEKAGAQLDPPMLYKDEAGHMVNIEPAFLPKIDIWEVKMRGMVDHILHGKPNLVPGEHGLMVQKMLDGIYESAEKNREVRIR